MQELLNLLPPGIAGVFGLMSLAEEEIERAQAEVDAKQKRLVWDAFAVMAPPEILRGKDDQLYRHHCRELIGRAVDGYDTREGTKAEVLCLLSNTSLMAPPSRDFAALFSELFVDIYGEALYRTAINTSDYWQSDLTGSYEAATGELLSKLRHKIRDESRVMPKNAGVKPAPRQMVLVEA